jgi:hypothetical protein
MNENLRETPSLELCVSKILRIRNMAGQTVPRRLLKMSNISHQWMLPTTELFKLGLFVDDWCYRAI